MVKDTTRFVSCRVAQVPPSGIRRGFDIAATMDDVISLGIGGVRLRHAAPDPSSRDRLARARAYSPYLQFQHDRVRTALAEHPKRLYGVAYDARSEVLVAVGVSEALYLAQTAVLDPGDEVIVPMPCFVAYQPEAVFPGGTPVPIETTVDDQLRVSAESLEAQITHSTKALLISYPNNPTGTVMWREGLLA